MKLELDLSPGDWADYGQAAIADLKRIGVLTPPNRGIREFVRLGVLVDGRPAVVQTPWLIWQAANEALTRHFGAPQPPATAPAPEPATPELPPVLADIAAAMAEHARRWDLDASHEDGTDPEGWQPLAAESREDATGAALTGNITWAHTFLEAVHAALATDDPAELRQALAAVAGCTASWMAAIDSREDLIREHVENGSGHV